MPVVVNEKRQKLSKRRDKVALEAYRDEGYLAEAMRNYLMLLGWAPSGDREIVPWSVIEDEFRLEDVNPSPAFFDEKKLRAFNGEYIRALRGRRSSSRACQPWLTGAATIAPPPWQPDDFDPAAFAAVAPLAQTRIAVLAEIVPNVDFLFLAEPLDRRGGLGQGDEGRRGRPARRRHRRVRGAADWDAESLKATLEAVGAERGLKLGKAQAPVRVAVTGRTVGPAAVRVARGARPRAHARPAARRPRPAGLSGPAGRARSRRLPGASRAPGAGGPPTRASRSSPPAPAR